MPLTELTKITGVGIHTQSNINSHNINSTGIITATKFVADGADLTGVSGFSTALSNDTSSLLNHVFKTSVQHNIGSGTSVTIQSDAGSGNVAFTRLNRINVQSGAMIRVAAGTIFKMNVLNNKNEYMNNFSYALGGSERISLILSVLLPLLILTIINTLMLYKVNEK